MSVDDAGAGKRELKPAEAFAAITYDRVLIFEKPISRTYVIQSGDDEYHWLSLNRHGAYCGDWYHNRIDTKDNVTTELRSEHCLTQAHEQPGDLKPRVRQMLRKPKSPENT